MNHRGVYLTIYSSYGKKLKRITQLAKQVQLNTFVIDVKNEYGDLLFESDAASRFLPEAYGNPPLKNPKKSLEELKKSGFYLIARIVVFKDIQNSSVVKISI